MVNLLHKIGVDKTKPTIEAPAPPCETRAQVPYAADSRYWRHFSPSSACVRFCPAPTGRALARLINDCQGQHLDNLRHRSKSIHL